MLEFKSSAQPSITLSPLTGSITELKIMSPTEYFTDGQRLLMVNNAIQELEEMGEHEMAELLKPTRDELFSKVDWSFSEPVDLNDK